MTKKEMPIDKLNRLRYERAAIIQDYKNHEISSMTAVKRLNYYDAEIRQLERGLRK